MVFGNLSTEKVIFAELNDNTTTATSLSKYNNIVTYDRNCPLSSFLEKLLQHNSQIFAFTQNTKLHMGTFVD